MTIEIHLCLHWKFNVGYRPPEGSFELYDTRDKNMRKSFFQIPTKNDCYLNYYFIEFSTGVN